MSFKDALIDYQTQVADGRLLDHPRQQQILSDLTLRLSQWMVPKVCMFYLWGSVGSGKTLIMNLICQHGPKSTQRWHYSDFINLFSHQILKKISGHYTWDDLVRDMFPKRSLVCIDEWVIEDITQLMLWKSLLPALWRHKVRVMTTSNLPVDAVYQDGLGREHFLPILDLIANKGFVYDLTDPVDYRCHETSYMPSPFEKAQVGWLTQVANQLTEQPLVSGESPVCQYNQELIWLQFLPAITPPSWRNDFVQWAHEFKFVCLADVSLALSNRNQLTNWVRLVDLLYDAGTHVFLTTTFIQQELIETMVWPERTRSRVLSWMQHQQQWFLQYKSAFVFKV